MSPPPPPASPAPRRAQKPGDGALAALRRAEWCYNPDADEMNVLLPGWEGRAGRAVLVDDEFYVRLDVETGRPLSILIPAYTAWQARQLARPGVLARLPLLEARRDTRRDAERVAVAAAVARALRASPEVAGTA
jgi:hypothetical protein